MKRGDQVLTILMIESGGKGEMRLSLTWIHLRLIPLRLRLVLIHLRFRRVHLLLIANLLVAFHHIEVNIRWTRSLPQFLFALPFKKDLHKGA